MRTFYRNKKSNSNSSNKIYLYHLVYVIIIFVIIQLFLLVICPGRVNSYAFDNFSFASTLVSIVLAVVSIVYTLQSGRTSMEQQSDIKNIEERIRREINKFSTIDKRINKALRPIESNINDIKQQTSDIKRSLDNNQNLLFMNSDKKSSNNETNNDKGDFEFISKLPIMFNLVFYACMQCVGTGKPFPFRTFKSIVGDKYYYCLGVIKSLAIFKSDILGISYSSTSDRLNIKHFDSSKINVNSINDLRYFLCSYNDKEVDTIVFALDDYFGKDKNCID